MFISCEDLPWHYDLGNGYYYLKSGGALDIDNYKGNCITYKSLFEDPIVFPKIEEYKFNQNFIICKQNYDKDLTNDLMQSAFEHRYDEIFYKKSKKEYFGIINYLKEYKQSDFFFYEISKLKGKNKIGYTKSITDSILNNNSLFIKMEKQKINYYILDKKSNKNYLVISKNKFQKLFKKLKIPDSLSIN